MIGGTNPDALGKSASEPAHGTCEVQAANPPSETADVAMGGMVPPDAALLVAAPPLKSSLGGKDQKESRGSDTN